MFGKQSDLEVLSTENESTNRQSGVLGQMGDSEAAVASIKTATRAQLVTSETND